ncbi:ABC transporter [Finegoldia magna]|uniref:ABC transporter n=1 Tax=Finegoldia magna TaxID=1260 RepID=UPI002803C1AD|nr:ABC transporter [Finegoldia magna]MDU1400011.1 ABC transporter [Finegoldia magna]
MYTIDNINKKRRLKKIDLDCSLEIEEGYIYLFTGHDKNIDELFDILGSFTTKYNGEFLYGFEEKENVLKNPKLTNEVEFSTFLQDYNSSMKVKKYLKLKKKLNPYFDEEFVDSVLKGFAIDEFARLEDLKEDYCNIVLMTGALATNKKIVLLKNFEIVDKKLSLEFIDIMKKRQELIRNTILISAPIAEEVFFDYLVLMQDGSVKFKDSKHNILTKSNVVRGPKEIITAMNYKRILTRTSDGLEDEIKMFDEINEDERILLENNGCVIKQLPLDELITMIEEGNYEKTVKTEVVE